MNVLDQLDELYTKAAEISNEQRARMDKLLKPEHPVEFSDSDGKILEVDNIEDQELKAKVERYRQEVVNECYELSNELSGQRSYAEAMSILFVAKKILNEPRIMDQIASLFQLWGANQPGGKCSGGDCGSCSLSCGDGACSLNEF